MQTILLPFFVGFTIALGSTLLVIRFSKQLGVLDDPNERPHPAKLHTQPTPRGGGIPILFTLLMASAVFFSLNLHIVAILAASCIMVGIGLLDDRKDISPYVRLAVNVFAAFIIVLSGITISHITNPFGGIIDLTAFSFTGIPVLSWIITLAWLVFLANTVSWSSGVDGQLTGFVPIAAATIGALSLRFAQDIAQWPVIILSALISGAYLGILPFSVYPQRIMPGYSGGALAGFLLGTLAILSGAKVATAVIVLGIPVMDALYTISRRLLSGKSPLKGDRGHLHHRLLELGWSKRSITLFYSTVTAFLGFLVLHLNSQQKFYTIVMLGVFFGSMIVWLTFGHLLKQRGQPIG